jgi:hypothetical protein
MLRLIRDGIREHFQLSVAVGSGDAGFSEKIGQRLDKRGYLECFVSAFFHPKTLYLRGTCINTDFHMPSRTQRSTKLSYVPTHGELCLEAKPAHLGEQVIFKTNWTPV